MLKPFTIISFVSVTLVLILVTLSQILGSDWSRVRIEALASQVLQLETVIDGPIGISWSGGLHLTLDDVHVGAQGKELVAAQQASISLALWPLFVGKLRILSIGLKQPVITIVRDMDDNFNFPVSRSSRDDVDLLRIAEISFTGATLTYINTPAQLSLSARDCALQLQQLLLPASPGTSLLQNVSFDAELSCSEFQQNTYSGTDLHITAVATGGVISLAPVSMQFLGGQGTGTLRADFSGITPQYQVHYVLPQLNLQGLLNTLPPELRAEGALDLTMTLALQGDSTAALTQSANGTIFLHGADLTLAGIDLDKKFEQFESSQNFDLVDAGAFFFAGPLGLLATKGYDFTSLLVESGGRSEIPSLISDWIITDGIARAADVALTTRQNRIALQGQLDLPNEQFVDVTMALVDGAGCALVQQEISGTFAQPQAAQSNIITTLASPIVQLLRRGVALLTDNPCEVFYSGAVQAP